MNLFNKTVIISTVTLFIGGLLGWQASVQLPVMMSDTVSVSDEEQLPALSVNLVTTNISPMRLKVSATGTVYPWQETIIGAEVNGLLIKELLVEVGDIVKKGQVLARLDARIINADLAQLKANLNEAEALVQEAKRNADRARQLEKTGALSEIEIAQYFTAYDVAQARVDALVAQIKAQQIRVDQSVIVASDDGIVSGKSASVGQVVSMGSELFRLIRQQRLEWRAELPDQDMLMIKSGQSVQVQVPNQTPILGVVRRVAPSIDNATRRGLVYVDLKLTAQQLMAIRSGSFVRGEFDLGAKDALTLPLSAVVNRDGFHYVFTINTSHDANNQQLARVHEQKIELGRIVDGRVEVLQGLNPDQQVVAEGAGFLANGDLVRIIPSTVQ